MSLKHFLLLFLICLASPSFSQLISDSQIIEKPGEQVNLSSPYHTTLSFFKNLEEGNFHPEKAAQTLDFTGIEDPNTTQLTTKLRQVFEGKGVLIRTSEVPNVENYQDSTSSEDNIYYFDKQKLPGVFLEKTGNQWKFSAFTVDQINSLHAETYPYGTAKLLTILPKIGNQEYLGLHLWQLVGIFILLILIFLAHWVFTLVVDKVLLYLFKRYGYGKVGENYILPVARVISIYLIVVMLSLFLRVLQLPVEIWSWILVVLRTLKPLLITVIFYKVVDIIAAYFTKLAIKSESTLDDQLVPLMRKTLKAFVVVIGTLFILRDGLDLDIIPFLTGLSIGGVAIALAAQDTIKNFFGSVMIFIDKPFQMGDWITSGDIDGTVEEVGFRSTRVRTFRNSLMYVPNGKIADSILDNHGLRQYRRFYTTLTITYDTPPELIEEFVNGLREIVLAHPNTRKDSYHVYFNNLSSFSQDIMFYIFFEVPTWGEELRSRHEILIQIVKLANSLGVRFAFPTQTLHMESFPEKQSLVPDYSPDQAFYQNKLSEFLAKEVNKKS
ncbi:mechanosensitive ion channel family protein [Algoriphagus halophytocola]|uniref:Mechanosensitive ion channel family protein n=1 Tax=Algoriphagus halophytocola TaxID=2991499 RepID=A0ABY6MIB7_9BACT|nr:MULTISPECIES: mechanosensitive ion channel family protein [unclassified Algoriphagus]UZD22162.1 mechanosensitive ion channel family protein [Algoriphagus sp. TR-M5]WBL43413.1 mechanosensitive ion channel family protein [Algoriphagus sp. TR-M9]